METYIIVLFTLLMAVELLSSFISGKKRYSLRETLENILTGGLSLLSDYGFSMLSYPLLVRIYDDYRIFSWKENAFYFILFFLLLDFIEYWFHRFSHTVPLMWTAHKVHHQGTFFNLSVGLRTSILIPIFNIGFYCIIPLLGFHPKTLLLFIFLQGTYQLFVHTETIKKLGILDHILVTPSVHRVHHGTNRKYIDKNFGKVLVLWDQLFGTFREEEEQVMYGVTDPENEKGILRCQVEPLRKWLRKKRASFPGTKRNY